MSNSQNTVSFGSLRPMLEKLPEGNSRGQKMHAILVALRAQMHGLPRPLSRRMALLTKRLGMATPSTSPAYLEKLRRELVQLDKDIRKLPHYQSLFGPKE